MVARECNVPAGWQRGLWNMESPHFCLTTPGSQAEASSLALRNSALVSAHTALPYILDPVSPPWLGPMGGGLGWGWGEKPD